MLLVYETEPTPPCVTHKENDTETELTPKSVSKQILGQATFFPTGKQLNENVPGPLWLVKLAPGKHINESYIYKGELVKNLPLAEGVHVIKPKDPSTSVLVVVYAEGVYNPEYSIPSYLWPGIVALDPPNDRNMEITITLQPKEKINGWKLVPDMNRLHANNSKNVDVYDHFISEKAGKQNKETVVPRHDFLKMLMHPSLTRADIQSGYIWDKNNGSDSSPGIDNILQCLCEVVRIESEMIKNAKSLERYSQLQKQMVSAIHAVNSSLHAWPSEEYFGESPVIAAVPNGYLVIPHGTRIPSELEYCIRYDRKVRMSASTVKKLPDKVPEYLEIIQQAVVNNNKNYKKFTEYTGDTRPSEMSKWFDWYVAYYTKTGKFPYCNPKTGQVEQSKAEKEDEETIESIMRMVKK